MSKDPFEMLADELTLIRRDIERLQRTSLDKTEAQAVEGKIQLGLENMITVGDQIVAAVHENVAETAQGLKLQIFEASKLFTEIATTTAKAEAAEAARDHVRAAEALRREASRRFGGLWVWIGCFSAVSALLGVLATLWIGGTISAHDFGEGYSAKYLCESAGGTKLHNKEGREYCAIWTDPPAS